MIKYIYTALIVAINVIFISLMVHGIEIPFVEINNSELTIGDVRLMHDYDNMHIYQSRVNTHDYYINSNYAINSVSLSFLSPFKKALLQSDWDFAKDELLYNRAYVWVKCDSADRRPSVNYKLSVDLKPYEFLIER